MSMHPNSAWCQDPFSGFAAYHDAATFSAHAALGRPLSYQMVLAV